jgi:hypothetical protein
MLKVDEYSCHPEIFLIFLLERISFGIVPAPNNYELFLKDFFAAKTVQELFSRSKIFENIFLCVQILL